MRRLFLTIVILSVLLATGAVSQTALKYDLAPMAPEAEKTTAEGRSQFYRHLAGFDTKLWLSNAAANGYVAWFRIRSGRDNSGIGMEYPPGSRIEHVYGMGPVVGAWLDRKQGNRTLRGYVVSTGYERQEMFGNPDGRDSFYVTSIDEHNGRNVVNVDDDADGRVDEDDFDGDDNDGDWDRAGDDGGRDGLPDSLEDGCRGTYDPVGNPDPAFDNYDSTGLTVDRCRADLRKMNDARFYTERNGLPNVGEPHVDEDGRAVSEGDVYVSYADIYGNPNAIPRHNPLGIKVWQRAYSWRNRVKIPVIPIEYNFINQGISKLDSVYVGIFADLDVGPTSVSGYYGRNFSGYWPDVRTAYTMNPVDRPSTPVGITVLAAPKPLDQIRFTFDWFPPDNGPGGDVGLYRFMAKGTIKPDEYPNRSDTRFILGFGPFQNWLVGDTLRIVVALVTGENLAEGVNNMYDNAKQLMSLYDRGWTMAPSPASPPLHIQRGENRVALNWKWRPGDPGCDPMQTWDDSNRYMGALPDTHWRRRDPQLRCNPPAVLTGKGGRTFEGFRVWRSESPTYDPRTFTLLRQYDVNDDLSFDYNNGIEFDLVDSGLVRGKKYWYSVTSFSIPTMQAVILPDPSGRYYRDTIYSTGSESDKGENAEAVILPFMPSGEVGKAKVVPNPYRTDVDYTFESGGWEGLGKFWTENRRVIWFIHLPSKCTIRVFSLSGDIVATLNHDDALRTAPDTPVGQEEWNLLSESGRAIASGIYVFTVESDLGRQIGKFAVIR
jgi:hypothetical protein